jgi:hypothetical protein
MLDSEGTPLTKTEAIFQSISDEGEFDKVTGEPTSAITKMLRDYICRNECVRFDKLLLSIKQKTVLSTIVGPSTHLFLFFDPAKMCGGTDNGRESQKDK